MGSALSKSSRREVLQRDVDRERRLRLDTEVRLRDSTSEADRCRARLASLQREFGRMEETVRAMLQYKAHSEQLKQEKTNLTVAYETRIHQFQNSITKLGQENETLRKQICVLEAAGAGEVQNTLLERLRDLETENCNLTRDAELQRRQYERCLDDVANQVVRALLTQKGLREEIIALQRRIKELEAQNRALASVLVQQLHQGSPLFIPGEAISKVPAGGAGDEPLVGHTATSNLGLPGLYAPSTCTAETPMTSDTSMSTHSSSDVVTPDDEMLKRRHCQQLITPTSSDLATPDDDMQKSCLRRQQVTPTSSDLVTPEEDTVKTCRLKKHQQHMLGKFSREDHPVDSREHVASTGALFTSLKTAALVDPNMLWLPLQRPRSLNLQLHCTSTGQQVAALAAVTASKCCQHRHSRPLIAHLSGSKVPSVTHNNNNAVAMEDEGSESPESGNRDEGYSTMSSDVQGEALRSGDQPVSITTSCTNGDIHHRRGLEDLKEATDETDMSTVAAVSGTAGNTAPSSTALVDCSSPGTAVSPSIGNRLLVVEDACDPDVLYIPLGLALSLSTANPRHSFPPSRDLLPYQHIMRSFSDSHLCLKITTAPSPSPINNQQHSSFSLSSMASSSPSVLVLDVLASTNAGEVAQKQSHPLRRTKATTSLLTSALSENRESLEEEDTHSNSGSWCSGGDVVVEGCWWDADYVQHWLRLDDTRSALQQQHRDLMELEYDQAELEDWSMSLSCEDITSSATSVASGVVSSADSSYWRRPGTVVNESQTPGQQHGTMLPSIQENNALELEEDSSECLWNNASYLIDHRSGGSELMTLLMDDGDQNGGNSLGHKNTWPYGNGNNGGIGGGNYSLASPGGSWSSTGTNSEECCHSYDCSYNGCSGSGTGGCQESSSKRSSAAMSGCSDDAASSESPAVIGTDFTRDFYRLVKFESTKSLASTSSRSLVGGTCVSDTSGSLTRRQGPDLSHMSGIPLSQDREQALQSVLNFIAEQQQYCASREEQDSVKEQHSTSSLIRPESQGCNDCQRSSENSLAVCPSQQVYSVPTELETKHESGVTIQLCSPVESSASDNNIEDQVSADRSVQHTEEDCSKTDTHATHTCSSLQEDEKTVPSDDNTRNPDSFEDQIHTIIELDTINHVYTSLEENEIQNSSNKKVKCSEVELNEQNSSSTKKMQHNNKVIHELKEEPCIDLKDILKPDFQDAYTEGEECGGMGISLTMQSHTTEVEASYLLKDMQQQSSDYKLSAKNPQTEHEAQLSQSDIPFNKDRDSSGEVQKCVEDSGILCESVQEQTSRNGENEVNVADDYVRSLYCSGSSQLLLGQCSKGLLHNPQCGSIGVGCCRVGEVLVTVIEEEDEHASSSMETSSCREMTDSITSTVSTPDTVVSPATRKTQQQHSLDLSVSQTSIAGSASSGNNGGSLTMADAPAHAWAVGFHERATSKDMIDELNRMIRKGEDGAGAGSTGSSGAVAVASEGDVAAALGATKLDLACCCPTGWVHIERDIDFTDPKARANLLDVMLASSGSSGASSNSSSSSSSSDSGDEPADYQHLHRLHRFRRQKKASATREQLGVLRYPTSTPRPSIIGRDDFFVRYGDKEREAVASFDFLEDISTTSVSGASSCDTLGSSQKLPAAPQQPQPSKSQPQQHQPPKKQPVQSEPEMTTPSSEDSDDRTGGQLSFSDSCAASFSGSSASLENQEE
ncbi:uncharacterized protein LOC111866279 isoform X3 [Cryptotermes secundus]|uniref:uncharacterized protein LOC111866279 isoform X3 n=1 Tax=Cryptotermes secundus TaxID=105785 RepID=UPI000CD7C18D|nr:uncharacterized protein LOC111866279 isoform X3 [Cryptotermes secundus]XP_023710845.1 uncharacterized protein LOC111866279 isoform X3 [Cryptotermes secundus]